MAVLDRCNLHTRLYCWSHKCISFQIWHHLKKEINRLSNGIRFISKKHCYKKEIIDQTQVSLLFVLRSFLLPSPSYAFQCSFLWAPWSVLLSSCCNCSRNTDEPETGPHRHVSLYYNCLTIIICTQVISISPNDTAEISWTYVELHRSATSKSANSFFTLYIFN